METTISKVGEETIVIINGRLDTPNSKVFEESIQPILQDMKPNVCVDCTHMEYISSSGLRQLLSILKHVKSVNGKLELKNLCPEVKEVFDMTGFSSIFNL